MSICKDCENYNMRVTGNIVDGVWVSFKEEETCKSGYNIITDIEHERCFDFKEKYDAEKHIADLKNKLDLSETHCRVLGSEAVLYKCILDDKQKEHNNIKNRFSSMLHIARQKSKKASVYDFCKMRGKVEEQKEQIENLHKSVAILLTTIRVKTETISELGLKLKKEKQEADKWHKDFLSISTKGIRKFIIQKVFGAIK